MMPADPTAPIAAIGIEPTYSAREAAVPCRASRGQAVVLPDLLDANENSWAFGGSSCDGRVGKPWSERWVCCCYPTTPGI